MIARMEIDALAELLGHTAVFSLLPLEARRSLLARSSLVICETAKVLQQAGTPHHHLYLVVDGRAEMCASTSDGEEIVVAGFGPYSFSSWIALYHDSPAQRDLVALAGTRLLAFPAAAVREVLELHPQLYPEVLKLEAVRFRASLDWQQQAMVADRTKRIAKLLLLMAQIGGQTGRSPRVSITGERLARIAQCSRETLRGSLAKLRSEDLIAQEYGALVLTDPARLKAMCEG